MYDELPNVPEFQRLLNAKPGRGVRLTFEETNEVVGIITSLMAEIWMLREIQAVSKPSDDFEQWREKKFGKLGRHMFDI